MSNSKIFSRKNFIKASFGVTGFTLLPAIGKSAPPTNDNQPNVIGPRDGFAPHLGTMFSMMAWMRTTVLSSVRGLSQEELDYLHDDKSNSIGSMLLHLAATERFYQIHTFDGKKWGDWPEADKNKFEIAMELGSDARTAIKGNNLSFYTDALNEVRNRTKEEFKKRNDDWLMAVDEKWFWGPTNNYCKWFHVCEHESNHNGQIKWIKGRLPGRK
jgi:uncharacterized damage-inducible protein DinB